MSAVALAIGGSAIIGAGASMYSANKAASAAKDGQRNLPDEIGGILGQVPAAGAASYANQQQYGAAYNALGNANLQSGLLGNVNWDAYARTPEAQKHIAESGDYYKSLGGDWTDAQKAQNFYANGYGSPGSLTYSGGLSDTLGALQGAQDKANATSATYQRNANFNDVAQLAPQYSALQRQLNPEYYGALGAVNSAAGSAIGASPYETAYGANALAGSSPLTLGKINESVNAPVMGGGVTLGQINSRVQGPGALTRQMSYGATNASTGPAALENTLYGQAQEALAQGGNLSAQDQRNATAASNAAYASRGLGDSNSALAGEVLNLDSARQARLDSNRAFASGVDTQLRSGQASDRNYGLNLDNANLARTAQSQSVQGQNIANQLAGANFNQNQIANNNSAQLSATALQGQLQGQNITNQLNQAQFNQSQRQLDLNALGNANTMQQQRGTDQFNRLATAAQLSSANIYDPLSALGTVDNRLNSTSTLGMGQSQFQGAPDYTSQLLGYGGDVYSSNANARVAGATNSANAYSALGGGLLSAAGSLGSAYIKNNSSAQNARAV